MGIIGWHKHTILTAPGLAHTVPDLVEIGDRRSAIGYAIEMMRDGDVVVIAGKGHEQGQIVGGVTHPFDDAAVAAEALAVHA